MKATRIAGRAPALSLAIAACALGGTACGGHVSARSGGNVGARHAWQDFFSSRTPISERIGLAEDGNRFAGLIRSRLGNWPGTRTAAIVHSVSLAHARQAQISYTILVNGKPVGGSRKGVAIYLGGRWKVGLAGVCAMLATRGTASAAALPPACGNAGPGG